MSNFFFSQSVFYPFLENFLPFSSNLKLLSANSFSSDKSDIMLFVKDLNLHQMTQFGLNQIESICRQQFRYRSNNDLYLKKDTKHCREKRKMLFTIIFSFSHNVFKTPNQPGSIKKGRKHCWKRKKLLLKQHLLLFQQCFQKAKSKWGY